jgi:hypothetical protein
MEFIRGAKVSFAQVVIKMGDESEREFQVYPSGYVEYWDAWDNAWKEIYECQIYSTPIIDFIKQEGLVILNG